MTADPFRPHVQEPEEPSRVRAVGMTVVVMLATIFLYQTMDNMQRASELAERRQRIAQGTCRDCSSQSDETDDSMAEAEAIAAAAAASAAADAAADAQRAHAAAATGTTATTTTTVPVDATEPRQLIPTSAPGGTP